MNQALALLVFVWAALLIPGAVRRSRSSPHATVGGFERAMDVLRNDPRRSGGRELLVPRDAGRIVDGRAPDRRVAARERVEDPVLVRRREWFVRALVAVAATFVLAVLAGGWMWMVFALTTVAAAGYIAVLRHHKLERDHARSVVRELDVDAVPDVAMPAAVGDGTTGGSVRLRRWNG